MICWLTFSAGKTNQNEFIDLFEKVIYQNTNFQDSNLAERVCQINSSYPRIREIGFLFRNYLDLEKNYPHEDLFSDIFQEIPQNDWYILANAIYVLGYRPLTKVFLDTIK